MTISKSFTRDIYDSDRRKKYLENYERIFGKKDKLGEELHEEVKKKQKSK